MKKAVIYIKNRGNKKPLDIEFIGEASVVDKWTNTIISNGFAIKIDIPTELEDKNISEIVCVLISEQAHIAGISDSWSNGENTVYNMNDIPTVLDENENPELDSNYIKTEGSEEIPFIAEHYKIIEK